MTPILSSLLRASRPVKSSIIAGLDAVVILISIQLSLGATGFAPAQSSGLVPFVFGAALGLMVLFGLYRHRLRIFDTEIYSRAILFSLAVASCLAGLIFLMDQPVGLTPALMLAVILLVGLTAYRVLASAIIGVVQNNWRVKTETLLERDSSADRQECLPALSGKTVMVTGAGGSIGSELCRQILAHHPAKLILFELSEAHLYSAQESLPPGSAKVIAILGDVTSAQALRPVFAAHAIDVVLHAAAYKHVPMVEQNEISGIRNNVFGTRNLAQIAQEYGVERFILISTDKAVRPTNIMGASKRMAEMVIQDFAQRAAKTIFSMVRFGNVLGSSGSVVPHFYQQIQSGGPVTVTHKDITRYFMTVPEPVGLVLKSAQIAKGGEVFLLDMGSPVRIFDLATKMIGLAGKTLRTASRPDGDIEIEISGLRPGEKIYEELLITECAEATEIDKISKAHEPHLSELETARMIRGLAEAITTQNTRQLRDTVQFWLPEYHAPTSVKEFRKAS